jgi:leucyl-tRNA synthetase
MVCHQTYKDKKGNWLTPEEVFSNDGKKYFLKKDTSEQVIVGPSESMSKSKKNIIDPEKMVEAYGADAVRFFILSDSPPEKDINWSDSGINGAWKICQKIWNLIITNKEYLDMNETSKEIIFQGKALSLMKLVHQNLQSITASIEKFQMNVAIAKVFELVNAISKFEILKKNDEYAVSQSLKILIRIIEPMVPHLAEECWKQTKSTSSLLSEPWPKVNELYLINDEVTVVVQINGKRRGEVLVKKDSSEEDVYNALKKVANINNAINGKNILKSIYVQNRILNIVLKS